MILENLQYESNLNIFSEIAELAAQYDALNLAQGSPDSPLDQRLKEFLIDAASHDMNPYAAAFMLPVLKESIIQFNARRKFPLKLHESEIMVVPGATYGMYVAFASFLKPGDEVIILEPCYDTYRHAIEIRNAKPVFIDLKQNNEPDWEKIKSSVSKKTKAIIINSPQNPTGKIWSAADWDLLWEIIENTQIVVISDEVYDVLHYGRQEFISAYHHPEIRHRCFCVFSFEKMFHISGWKAGYVIASPEYISAFSRIHQCLTFTVNVHAQYALSKYLDVFDAEKQKLLFLEKRNLFNNLMRDLPFELAEPSEGGYFQTVNFLNYNSYLSDKEFSELLVRKAQVAAVPYSAFYHDKKNTGKLRFCFAKKDETLFQAAENLKRML